MRKPRKWKDQKVRNPSGGVPYDAPEVEEVRPEGAEPELMYGRAQVVLEPLGAPVEKYVVKVRQRGRALWRIVEAPIMKEKGDGSSTPVQGSY